MGPWAEMHNGIGWGGWLVSVLLLLILVALVVGVVLALVRSSGGRPGEGDASSSSPAQQLLDERYARGEIDEIEYLHRRAVLRGS
jgi:putative membrane protein